MKLVKLIILLLVLIIPHEALALLTSGNVTIKLSAGTYSSWAGFWDDIGNLTDDITCTVDASAFTEDSAPAAVTESLNNHTLHVLPAAFPTTTDGSTGARFTLNYVGKIISIQTEGPGTLIIEGMVWLEGTSHPDALHLSTVSTAFALILRRNIIKGCTGIELNDITVTNIQVYNNIFYDNSVHGIYMKQDCAGGKFSNNTVVNNGNSGITAGTRISTYENNLSYGNTVVDYFQIDTNPIGNNNADSDATGEDADWGGGGADNVSSISDPFTAIGSDDFTISAAGAMVVGGAGKDLSGSFTDDFFGVTRVNWTIGAVEYEGVIVEEVTIKLSAGTYSSWAAFWDDRSNLATDVTCTVDASAFTEGAAPAGVTENLNGYTLHILPESFPTTTDAATGARFTCNYVGSFINMQMEGAGTIIIEGIVLIKGTSTPAAFTSTVSITTDFIYIIRRNIITGTEYGLRNSDASLVSLQWYNNIIYDTTTQGIDLNVDMTSAIIANNTIVNCIVGLDAGDEEITFENNLIYGNSPDWQNIEILTIGNNNADSDATAENADWGGGGANNVNSIGNPFNNLGADDFTITAEGVIGTAGKDLSGSFTDDFFGTTRVNWTIGALEFISVGWTGTALGLDNPAGVLGVDKANLKNFLGVE